MKLTTKIIFGIILSIFVISLLFITGFSFSERKNYDYMKTHSNATFIPQDNPIGINVESTRVVLLEMEREDNQTEIIYGFASDNNGINLSPQTEEGESKLFIPEALYEFVVVKTQNDTLSIQIKIDELRKKYDEEGLKKYMFFSGINLNLQTSN